MDLIKTVKAVLLILCLVTLVRLLFAQIKVRKNLTFQDYGLLSAVGLLEEIPIICIINSTTEEFMVCEYSALYYRLFHMICLTIYALGLYRASNLCLLLSLIVNTYTTICGILFGVSWMSKKNKIWL